VDLPTRIVVTESSDGDSTVIDLFYGDQPAAAAAAPVVAPVPVVAPDEPLPPPATVDPTPASDPSSGASEESSTASAEPSDGSSTASTVSTSDSADASAAAAAYAGLLAVGLGNPDADGNDVTQERLDAAYQALTAAQAPALAE
jgi:hypothetical protein